MNKDYSSFTEFVGDPAHTTACLCRVTYGATAAILWFESSNGKWYAPAPYEGREEIGYAGDIWLSGENERIVHIKVLTSYEHSTRS